MILKEMLQVVSKINEDVQVKNDAGHKYGRNVID